MNDDRLLVRLSRHRGRFIAAALALGFLIGLGIHQTLLRPRPPGPKTLDDFIRDLEARDSAVDRLWQMVWDWSPDAVRTRLSHVRPISADQLRLNAAREIARFGPEAEAAVPGLVDLLQDPNPITRELACYALAAIGPKAEPAVPRLWAVYAPGSPGIGRAAVQALASIIPFNEKLRKDLVRELEEGNREVLAGARSGEPLFMDEVFVAPGVGVPVGNAIANPLAIYSAVNGLGSMARANEAALSDLLRVLPGAVPGVQLAIVEELRQLGPGTPEVVEALTRCLEVETSWVRAAALRALGTFGPGASASATRLSVLLERSLEEGDEERNWTGRLIDTLGQIGPNASEALPRLAAISWDKNSPHWLRAAVARWRIEGRADEVKPIFLEALKASDMDLVNEAARHLVGMGAEGLPELLGLLSHGNFRVRVVAVRAMGELKVEEAVPVLERMLTQDPKYSVRLAAEAALKQIRPEAQEKWKADVTPPRTGATQVNGGEGMVQNAD